MRAVNIYFLHRCRSLYSYVQSDLWPLDLSWDFQAVAPDAATLCSLFCFTMAFILSSSSRLIHCPIITSQFMVGQMVMWHGGAVGFQVLAWLSSPILRLWPWCLSLSCGPSVSSSCSSSWVWTLRWGREHRTPCLHIFDLKKNKPAPFPSFLQFVGMEVMMTSITDMFPKVLRKAGRRELFLLLFCLICFFSQLVMITQVRIYLCLSFVVTTYTKKIK